MCVPTQKGSKMFCFFLYTHASNMLWEKSHFVFWDLMNHLSVSFDLKYIFSELIAEQTTIKKKILKLVNWWMCTKLYLRNTFTLSRGKASDQGAVGSLPGPLVFHRQLPHKGPAWERRRPTTDHLLGGDCVDMSYCTLNSWTRSSSWAPGGEGWVGELEGRLGRSGVVPEKGCKGCDFKLMIRVISCLQ